MQSNIANPEMQSRARCFAIALLIFSIFCLDPIAILLAIFLIIASSCDYDAWEGWKTVSTIFYVLNLIAVIGCLVSFTIAAFFFVYVAATYKAIDPIEDSYESAAGLLAFFFFVYLALFIVQLVLCCKAYSACRNIFSSSAAMPIAYIASPGYAPPQGR